VGKNGENLKFSVLHKAEKWNPVPGLYIFARLTRDGWEPLYVGQTDDFSNRIPHHERWEEAARLGAGYVHAVVVRSEATRKLYEKSLIQLLNPPLNDQFKQKGSR
jgi:hypothetical protein